VRSNLSQINSVNILPLYFRKFQFNIILPSTYRSSEWFFPSRFSTIIFYPFFVTMCNICPPSLHPSFFLLSNNIDHEGSRGSSVSIVSGYELDDREIEIRSPTEARDFSPDLCVQTGYGAHPTSYPVGTGGPFPGGKARPGLDADHSPHLVPRS
jgi:hypothetical protein